MTSKRVAILRIGRLPVGDLVGILLAAASIAFSFVPLVREVGLTIFAVGFNSVLTAFFPFVAIVLTLLGRTVAPVLDRGLLDIRQVHFAVAVGAAVGWLNVSGAGGIAIAGVIVSVIWILWDAVRRLVPALGHRDRAVIRRDAGVADTWREASVPADNLVNILPAAARGTWSTAPVQTPVFSPTPASTVEEDTLASATFAGVAAPAEPAVVAEPAASAVVRPSVATEQQRRAHATSQAALTGEIPVVASVVDPVAPRPAPVQRVVVPATAADTADASVAAQAIFHAHGEQSGDIEPPAHLPFWVLVPQERAVVDENGDTLFVVGPSAWALAIDQAPESLVLRDFDGRVGTLTDVSGVIRN